MTVLLASISLAASSTPAAAAGTVTPMVATGASHTCAVREDGTAWCWGSDESGRLGAGGPGDSAVPVQVMLDADTPLTDVVQVSAGVTHNCAVDREGGAWCWGDDGFGRLGIGGTGSKSFATRVRTGAGVDDLLSGVIQISAGFEHTCAVDDGGQAWCWGDDFFGQLGRASGMGGSNVAVKVRTGAGAFFDDAAAISVGDFHSCAVDRDGGAWCWGIGADGQLGNGLTDSSDAASRVRTGGGAADLLGGITEISAGGRHTCAVSTTGAAWCWGRNANGQLGTGNNTARQIATPVSSPVGVQLARISAGGEHTCAVTTESAALCWGLNGSGQLGDGSQTSTNAPIEVLIAPATPLTEVTRIAAGEAHSCAHATTDDGIAWCWGANGRGRLGDGTTTARLEPVTVLASTGGAAFLLGPSSTVEQPEQQGASGPTLTCSPSAIRSGMSVTCTVTGGDPGIDILWRVAINPVIASAGVTLGADGTGTFSFIVPVRAIGSELTVELVEWTAPLSLGVVGGPVPSSVPGGEGSARPEVIVALLLVAMTMFVVAAARDLHGARRDGALATRRIF